MNDDYNLRPPETDTGYCPDDDPDLCELCDDLASEIVDIDPVRNPGRYMARLCKICAEFERARIKKETNYL